MCFFQHFHMPSYKLNDRQGLTRCTSQPTPLLKVQRQLNLLWEERIVLKTPNIQLALKPYFSSQFVPIFSIYTMNTTERQFGNGPCPQGASSLVRRAQHGTLGCIKEVSKQASWGRWNLGWIFQYLLSRPSKAMHSRERAQPENSHRNCNMLTPFGNSNLFLWLGIEWGRAEREVGGSHDTGFQLYLASGPQPFWQQGPVFVEDNFSMDWVVEGGFEMMQAYYIYYALYFYYYYISSTSDNQEVGDPWYRIQSRMEKKQRES